MVCLPGGVVKHCFVPPRRPPTVLPSIATAQEVRAFVSLCRRSTQTLLPPTFELFGGSMVDSPIFFEGSHVPSALQVFPFVHAGMHGVTHLPEDVQTSFTSHAGVQSA